MDLNNGIVMTVDLGADAGEKVVGDLVECFITRGTGEATNNRGARHIIMILIPSGAIHELLP